MKIMITGATGLLGRAVYAQLAESKNVNDVVGTGFSRAESPLEKLNLRKRGDVDLFLDKHKPECLIHCAAERRPDVSEAEPEASEELNVDVTRYLAEQARIRGICMIYISTDYVFDGTNPPYYLDSKPNPLNFYGRTKLAGEKAVQKALSDFTILRVPILYGGELYPTESSISSIAAALHKNRGGTFDDVAVRYPTYTGDIARVLEDIVRLREAGEKVKGIYHFSGREPLTKYTMARIMAPFLRVDERSLSPDRTGGGAVKRPKNSHLDTEKLDKLIALPITSFKDEIEIDLRRLFKG